jgi:hypothetical protein
VHKVSKVHKESKVLKEFKEHRESKVLRVSREHKVFKVLKVSREQQEIVAALHTSLVQQLLMLILVMEL